MDLTQVNFTPKRVLDIGANVGHWYREAVLHWPDAYFWLVEGNPECEEALLSITREEDNCDMVLLSDVEKEVTFYTRKDSPACTGASYYRENTPFYEGDKAIGTPRRAWPLDDFLDGAMFDLIKIDVQGAELDVMRGGINTLFHAQAVILEVARVPYNEGAPLEDEVKKFMYDHEFRQTQELGRIVHPITREWIQTDVIYYR